MKTLNLMIAAGLLAAASSFAGATAINAPACPYCTRTALASGPACTDRSVYQLDSTWTTDQRKPIKLGDLAGRPQVMLMFFSRCTSACPILLNDLRRIEAALPADVRSKTGFTMISFDTAHDTPAALAEYRKNWNLPAGNWTLLSGKPDDVMELAALFGVKYKLQVTGQFAHSNVITVLNAKGEIVHQQTGLNSDITETVHIIEQLNSH